MELSNAVMLLSSLAHQSRLRIFRLLVRSGPRGIKPTALSETLDMPPATLSFHLKELHHAGLVSRSRQGRSVFYSADYVAMSALIGYLQENCCLDDSCSPPQPGDTP